MASWHPLELDPELALALELDIMSEQPLFDVSADGNWQAPHGSDSSHVAAQAEPTSAQLPPLPLPPPPADLWPSAADQLSGLPMTHTAGAGLLPLWSDSGCSGGGSSGAAPGAAAAWQPAAAAHAAAGPAAVKSTGPARGSRSSTSVGSRYDKPGARERKREQQRSYRQRCRQRADEQQSQLAAMAAGVAQARQEQQQLCEEQAALQKVREYKDSLAELLPLSGSTTAPLAGSSGSSASATALQGLPASDSSGAPLLDDSSCCDSGGGGSASTSSGCSSQVGTKQGDWEAPFPTHWCTVGLASGRLPAPGAALIDSAVALAAGQHSLPFEGKSSSGGLASRLAAALLAVPEALCRQLMGGIKPCQLADRERGFRNLVQAAVEEWEANPAGRRRAEYRMQLLWTVRLKCVAFVARMRPEVMREARSSRVLPAPLPNTAAAPSGCSGGGSGGEECEVHHLLPPIMAQLGISREQRRRILVHWQEYQQRVAVARQLGREAMQQLQRQEAARQQGGIPGAAGTLCAAAKHFLSSFQAASELAALPSEEAAAWLELQHAIWQILTPLQNSRLLLGCAPYVPDCTQMCRVLEWQQQRQRQQGQLERRLSQGDPGHLLAAAGGGGSS